ncbi:MAG: MFS transporter, partial [Pseudonocardiaceae bacterium]
PAAVRQDTGRSLLRNPLAWTVTVFFGLQALIAFVVIGWLPQVLMDAGVTRGDAGLLLALLSLLALPVSLLVPPMAARQGDQSGWIVALGVCGLAGLIGLLLAPGAAPLLWVVLLGLGMSVFSLALTVIALRARTSADTARLSGMAQGFGYLIAGTGPFLFGLLHEVTGGWTVPLLMLIGVLVVQIGVGALAGRPRLV